jgi:hypothetical protein
LRLDWRQTILSWLVQNIKKALSNSQRIMTIPAVNVPIDKILTDYSRLRKAKISRRAVITSWQRAFLKKW